VTIWEQTVTLLETIPLWELTLPQEAAFSMLP
jgi:hypothetical protein